MSSLGLPVPYVEAVHYLFSKSISRILGRGEGGRVVDHLDVVWGINPSLEIATPFCWTKSAEIGAPELMRFQP